ncbi:hypothetical protein [Frigoribacterium sp. UYMn621]|uniref:hypothetical protein n=1 Tax=Frigoribacterium sp. UYMn621 TaxID=3156343 RepID=UPI003396EB19
MTTPTIDTTPTIATTAAPTQEEAVPPTAGDTSRSLGITSLVLAIASIAFGYTLIVPIAAIVVGSIGLNREPAGRNFSTWGIIVGAVSLALPVLALAFGLAFLAPLGAFAAFFGQ